MRYALLLIVGMAWITQAHGAQGCAELEKGWTLETKAVSGALCAEVLLSAQSGSDAEGTRRLRVFENGKPGFTSDAAAQCKTCGGALGDPFQGIAWKSQTLEVSNYGGSRESWSETWKLVKRGERWIIAGWDRQSMDRLSGDSWSESVNALTGKATAKFAPGAASGKKPRDLACGYKIRMPRIGQLKTLRETQAYACGLCTGQNS